MDHGDEEKRIGAAMRQLREMRKLTQDDAVFRCRMAGMTVQKEAISRWENGLRDPGVARLARYLKALGSSLGELAHLLEDDPMEAELERLDADVRSPADQAGIMRLLKQVQKSLVLQGERLDALESKKS